MMPCYFLSIRFIRLFPFSFFPYSLNTCIFISSIFCLKNWTTTREKIWTWSKWSGLRCKAPLQVSLQLNPIMKNFLCGFLSVKYVKFRQEQAGGYSGTYPTVTAGGSGTDLAASPISLNHPWWVLFDKYRTVHNIFFSFPFLSGNSSVWLTAILQMETWSVGVVNKKITVCLSCVKKTSFSFLFLFVLPIFSLQLCLL